MILSKIPKSIGLKSVALGAILVSGVSASSAGSNDGSKVDKKPPVADTSSRRAKRLAARFPRTRGLLSFLEKNAPNLYRQLVVQANRRTPRQGEAALRLAKDHHPELASLLVGLEESDPRAYDSGMRELVNDALRLERLERRDEKEFSAALETWSLRSQVRLLAARVALEDDPELRVQLEALVKRQEKAERHQAEAQLERLRRQMRKIRKRLDQDPETIVDQKLRSLERKIHRQAKDRKRATKKDKVSATENEGNQR